MRVRSNPGVLAVGCIIVLLLAACGLTKQERDAASDVAEKFANAVSSEQYAEAASYTTDPQKAEANLNFAVGQLEEPEISYTLTDTKASAAEGTASYDVTLTVRGRELSYPVTAQLVTDDHNNWKLDWEQSVIHPKLADGTHLQINNAPGNKPTVLDRTGQPLMSEQLVTVIRLDPTAVTDVAGTAQTLAGALAPVVPSITADQITTRLTSEKEAFTLAALRPEDAVQIVVPELPGVTHNKQARLLTTDRTTRSMALAGLNEVWSDAAAQSTGWSLDLEDAKNEVIETLLDVPAAAVTNIQTSLDIALQKAAQAAVDKVSGQAVIVAIQPSTGGILAVAQNLAADLEGAIALTGQYPPGSTFKIVTTTAVLTAGLATPDDVLPCPATASIKGRTIPNDDQFDLGSVPLHTAFAQSCNTTIATLAAELPADALTDQARQLGLGVDYVSAGITTITGSVPEAANDAQLVEDSIGQGKVLASPFGMALVAATVAKGTAPVPILLPGTETEIDAAVTPPSPEAIADVQAMMAETVTSGTATALNDIGGVAGKTGTAQYGDGSQSHGWFVGYYKDVAFAVLLVGGGSSKPAVDVAGDFLRTAGPAIPG